MRLLNFVTYLKTSLLAIKVSGLIFIILYTSFLEFPGPRFLSFSGLDVEKVLFEF